LAALGVDALKVLVLGLAVLYLVHELLLAYLTVLLYECYLRFKLVDALLFLFQITLQLDQDIVVFLVGASQLVCQGFHPLLKLLPGGF